VQQLREGKVALPQREGVEPQWIACHGR
jgi:hypothetical protein